MTILQHVRKYREAGKRDEDAWDTAEKITRQFEAELIAEQIEKGESITRASLHKQALQYLDELEEIFHHFREIKRR